MGTIFEYIEFLKREIEKAYDKERKESLEKELEKMEKVFDKRLNK